MSLDSALLWFLTAMAIPNVIVAAILVRAAWQQPRIRFLTATAIGSVLVAAGIVAYVVAANNAALGYPLDRDFLRLVLRVVLIGLGVYPFLWLRDYLTGRFQ